MTKLKEISAPETKTTTNKFQEILKKTGRIALEILCSGYPVNSSTFQENRQTKLEKN